MYKHVPLIVGPNKVNFQFIVIIPLKYGTREVGHYLVFILIQKCSSNTVAKNAIIIRSKYNEYIIC